MIDFVTRISDLGTTTEKLARKERKYQGRSVTDMRQDLISRAQATIAALEAHKGRVLRAPMARTIRNGIEVKIGYGRRNVGFFEGQDENRVAIIPERRFAHDRKLLAIDYLQQAVAAVQAGEFDGLLAKALADMTARFTVTPAIDEEKPNNVLALQAA